MRRAELEPALGELARAIDYPATPDVVGAVRSELRANPAPSPSKSARRRFAAIAVGALLATGGVAVAAVPDLREAALDLIDLRGETIESTTAPAPDPPRSEPDLGRAVTLEEARAELGFDPVLPDIGAPDELFVRSEVPGGELAASYRDGELLVTQFRGDVLPYYAKKIVPMATRVSELRVEGDEAVWIAGAPHFFAYMAPDGSVRENRTRVAENVLVLERGRLLVRIEGELTRTQAIRLARTLR